MISLDYTTTISALLLYKFMLVKIIDSPFFTILYPITLIIAVLIGYLVARRNYVKKDKNWRASGIETSVIAIFGLLLSFTFLASNNSMKDRLKILHITNDAAANLRRQSYFTSDTIRNETKAYLLQYLDLMSGFRDEYLTDNVLLVKKMEAINQKYLQFLSTQAKISEDSYDKIMPMLAHYKELNANFYLIYNSYIERTPDMIIILIIVASLLIGVLVGFLNGFSTVRHYLVPLIFIVIVSLCIQIIRDLDNPYGGTIQPAFSEFKYQEVLLLKSSN